MLLPDNFESLNPVNGCPINCTYCYAKRMNERFKWIDNWIEPQFFPKRLKRLEVKKPHIFFLDTTSDFATWKPEWIEAVLKVCNKYNYHQYMTITKAPELFTGTLPNNWWYGVTVTNKQDMKRINQMKNNVRGCHYHICFEPLMEDLGNLDLTNIEWIEIGAESGNRKDKIIPHKDWLMNIINQAKSQNIPILMKDNIIPIIGIENYECLTPFKF